MLLLHSQLSCLSPWWLLWQYQSLFSIGYWRFFDFFPGNQGNGVIVLSNCLSLLSWFVFELSLIFTYLIELSANSSLFPHSCSGFSVSADYQGTEASRDGVSLPAGDDAVGPSVWAGSTAESGATAEGVSTVEAGPVEEGADQRMVQEEADSPVWSYNHHDVYPE